MADLIKKIKIKKQDGTFTDYIPIGADAVNIETSDGESVELALNKKINKSDIIDNLNSSDSTKVLSAKQGKELKAIIDQDIKSEQTLFIGDSYCEGYSPDGNTTS